MPDRKEEKKKTSMWNIPAPLTAEYLGSAAGPL